MFSLKTSIAFSCSLVYMSVFIMYICPRARCLKDRERNAYHEGRKLSLRSSGKAAEKCFIACSHTLIDAYITPPVLPQQHLKIPKSTISPSPLESLCPSAQFFIPTTSCAIPSYPPTTATFLFPVCHYILPLTLLYLNNCYHSLDILPSWVIDFLCYSVGKVTFEVLQIIYHSVKFFSEINPFMLVFIPALLRHLKIFAIQA